MRYANLMLISSWLVVAQTAWASDVVVCTAQNPVKAHLQSVHTPDYTGDPLNLINPSLDAVSDVHPRYWKCVDTNVDGTFDAVAEMTPAEKDALDAPLNALRQLEQDLATEQAALDALDDNYLNLTLIQQREVQQRIWTVRNLKRRLGAE